jgi:hypothetical protein
MECVKQKCNCRENHRERKHEKQAATAKKVVIQKMRKKKLLT